MRAMILGAAGPPESNPLALREVADPVPGPGEIRLRVSACGVCRTDLHVVEGELVPSKPDLIPGHQVVGEVDRVGPGAEGFRVGDRVGVTWLFSTRGGCEYCLSARENLCERARFTGLHADGGYAEAMGISASPLRAWWPPPPCPGCAGAARWR